MSNKRQPCKPPRNYIAYFALCQEIGEHLQELGRNIARAGVHAPLFHEHILSDLKEASRLYEWGTKAILQAQEDWKSAETRKQS